MILNTGQRTDIPAFYADWFLRRVREGSVMVRNPFNYQRITSYRIDPEVVDVIAFCTKNPAPMLGKLGELAGYRQYWHVTITPYDRDIEPNVPPAGEVISSFRKLSGKVGKERTVWRYDPILLTETFTPERHICAFRDMAEKLEGSTESCVISFIDLYKKTIRNFPEAERVSNESQYSMAERMAKIGEQHGIYVSSCLEDPGLAKIGIDTSGCMTKEKLEKAFNLKLKIPNIKTHQARQGCACLLGNDIGAYTTCPHLCKYCYANESPEAVIENRNKHDPHSPLLIGHVEKEDQVVEARQESWIDREISLF